jgi:hypothetical protein
MNIHNALLENKNFVTYTLAGLVEVERDRILSTGLATPNQLSSLSDVTEYMVKMAKSGNTDVLVNSLANLCTLLKSIKLPGDFEKYTIGSPSGLGEEFYIALDLPYDGEKFHDLSSITKDKEDDGEEECVECEKESKEEDKCEDCADDSENVQDILADAVNVHLKKIAEALGDKGDHEAAYLVERTMRSINREAENGKLFGNK